VSTVIAMCGFGVAAERDGELDPQSLVVQSVGVLIGRPLFIAGKVALAFGTSI